LILTVALLCGVCFTRAFFLALFNYALMLGTRGCSRYSSIASRDVHSASHGHVLTTDPSYALYRTALEYCKLLLTLDPSDPFAVHLVVDYFALRTKEYSYVLRFAKEYNAQGNSSAPAAPRALRGANATHAYCR
jgi:hypothetical protein